MLLMLLLLMMMMMHDDGDDDDDDDDDAGAAGALGAANAASIIICICWFAWSVRSNAQAQALECLSARALKRVSLQVPKRSIAQALNKTVTIKIRIRPLKIVFVHEK